MQRKNYLIALFTCFAICVLSGCDTPGTYEVPRRDEVARVTSPYGKLDAVLVREDAGGAPGGWEWSVYIVSVASPVTRPRARAIFRAGSLTNEKISWPQEHLLDIGYNIAEIDSFRNVWASYELRGKAETMDDRYYVEIRLRPSTEGFSLLTPDGDFRQK